MDNDSKNTESGFFTMKGYAGHKAGLTASMEDYLEMIFRLSRNGGVVRISELAACLHVRPPSASKMLVILKDMGFVSFQKYGYLSLTDKGKKAGEYLLHRHDTIHKFLCMLNGSKSELEQAEKLEHYLDERTVENLARLTEKMQNDYER